MLKLIRFVDFLPATLSNMHCVFYKIEAKRACQHYCFSLGSVIAKEELRVYLRSAYFVETENFLLKILYIKVKIN